MDSEEYYRISDTAERSEYLNTKISEGTDTDEWQLRLEILKRRFVTQFTKGKLCPDIFMRGWVMTLSESAISVNFLNERAKEKSIRKNFSDLCILLPENDIFLSVNGRKILFEEWNDFAKTLIRISLQDKSYGSAFMGMITGTGNFPAARLRQEVDSVTLSYPSHFGLADVCLPFREIILNQLQTPAL